MSAKIKKVIFTTLVWLIASATLFSGSEILLYKLLFIHVGTLFAWIALAAFAYTSYLLVHENPQMKVVQSIVLALALIWFVVSSLLSGNTNLVFDNQPIQKIWVFYTSFIVLVSLFTALVVAIKNLFQRNNSN